MIQRLLIAAFLMSCAAIGAAAELCPRTDLSAEWSEKCFQVIDGVRRVKGKFVDHIRSNGNGATRIMISETHELVAVDAHGRVILQNIAYTGDFDLPNPDGIGRFASQTSTAGDSKKRCGYFLEKNFKIIVAPQFDYCEAFASGAAQACIDCVAYCADAECHSKTLVGGQGVDLDTEGRIRRRYDLPNLNAVCGHPNDVRIEKRINGMSMLHCSTRKAGPFDRLR